MPNRVRYTQEGVTLILSAPVAVLERSYQREETRAALNRVIAEALGYDVERWERDHQAVEESIPAQELGREEIDPLTWEAR